MDEICPLGRISRCSFEKTLDTTGFPWNKIESIDLKKGHLSHRKVTISMREW